MSFDSLLLVYYHPVVFDLALSFKKLFKNVEMCVVNDLKDNYGTNLNVMARARSCGIRCIPLNAALLGVRAKQYEIVGLDGVFQGDSLMIDSCEKSGTPYFAISGYPHTTDEPARNILSFSWYMPQVQYRKAYPTEGHVKQLNWSKIADLGYDKTQKNFFVFYPEFVELKKTKFDDRTCETPEFVSMIHRFEECNEKSFHVFKRVSQSFSSRRKLNNYTNLDQVDTWKKLHQSMGLIHLKHGDCPGIVLLEAMLLGRVPIVMKDFISASQNQEVLIENHSVISCKVVDELIYKSHRHADEVERVKSGYTQLETSTMNHAYMLTDFERQRDGLKRFFLACLLRA